MTYRAVRIEVESAGLLIYVNSEPAIIRGSCFDHPFLPATFQAAEISCGIVTSS